MIARLYHQTSQSSSHTFWTTTRNISFRQLRSIRWTTRSPLSPSDTPKATSSFWTKRSSKCFQSSSCLKTSSIFSLSSSPSRQRPSWHPFTPKTIPNKLQMHICGKSPNCMSWSFWEVWASTMKAMMNSKTLRTRLISSWKQTHHLMLNSWHIRLCISYQWLPTYTSGISKSSGSSMTLIMCICRRLLSLRLNRFQNVLFDTRCLQLLKCTIFTRMRTFLFRFTEKCGRRRKKI